MFTVSDFHAFFSDIGLLLWHVFVAYLLNVAGDLTHRVW